ncbi:major facilitator superfamily domain-containing protein [Pavlovales sp. CCMP2436]|nr:major facilitator superfamily domain-containing protein [Pavlovales sp. CCMP2436]|mmetsp:Transcript_16545/g.42222  ORF Transcript_16545/g.42222 Transcript_16545/m.42222 type:complete len:496 (-) Transcript_16545:15-1502(-)
MSRHREMTAAARLVRGTWNEHAGPATAWDSGDSERGDENEPLKSQSRRRSLRSSSILLGNLRERVRCRVGTLVLLSGASATEAVIYTLELPNHLSEDHRLPLAQAEFIFLTYTIGCVAATPFLAPITRALGCNSAICAGLLTLGLAQLCYAFSATLPAFVCTRLVSGFAAGLIRAAVLTRCHQMSLREANMGTLFGTVISSVSIGSMVGPALGGLLFRAGGWHMPLLIAAAACLLFAAFIAMVLPEDEEHSLGGEQQLASAGPLRVLCSWRLLAVLVMVYCGAMVFSSVDEVLPSRLERDYGHTQTQAAFIFTIISVSFGVGATSIGIYVDISGRALRVSMAGMVGLCATLPLFALPLPHWSLFAPVAMLFGVSATAQLIPASTLLEQVASVAVFRHTTLTYAVFNSAYVSGVAVGPSLLVSLTQQLGFEVGALCLSLGALTLSGAAAFTVSVLQLEATSYPGPPPTSPLLGLSESAAHLDWADDHGPAKASIYN